MELYNENDIQSYMKQFNVTREVAEQELTEIMIDYWDKQTEEMNETYASIIRDTH